MTTYAGPPRGSGRVRLIEPSGANLAALADAEKWHRAGGMQEGVVEAVESWTNAALERDDVFLFEIAEEGRPVGQIFLHDIDHAAGESLLGYHLVADKYRGRGIGTEALALLVDYVRENTDLRQLVIITLATTPDRGALRRRTRSCWLGIQGKIQAGCALSST